MIKPKLLLATTISLVSASAPMFAAPAGASSVAAAAVKTTSQANVQAESAEVTQPPVEGSVQNTSSLVSSSPLSRKSSLYAGLGIDMLNNRGFTGLIPKAMVGYGIYYGQDKNFYSALEVGGAAGTILLSTNNQQYRVSSFVNASIIPGYMIYDDVMLYARLGVQSTRYSQLNSTKTGGLYGVGIRLVGNQRWDTRFEYNYANNKNLNQYIIDFIYKFRC